MIGGILFTGTAAAICGGVGTEASSPNRYAAEVDAAEAAMGNAEMQAVLFTAASKIGVGQWIEPARSWRSGGVSNAGDRN